ncbi:sigma-70 RNA polymerase sigma factor region 4 domain-containing protein [Paenibacillus polymyxa]|uniref:sigma-70 family RNA polymerase sigma factor n=1 Tax=Paenibacillus polymyxa TaxID=1406 RepID=UPI00129B0194|nr:sigma-70 family RNA polymerase sigma factor [Paenibacillus polymyxa]KAE8559116.1 hypothetical protein BJH92_16010 [Paenibacillus polymyxa]MCJ1222260.1 sigma-70 family RNA polymerase sigma factor [Paenibacillus polymyxa]
MEHNQVTKLLKNYRSYQYAVKNCGSDDDTIRLPLVISERKRNPDSWDRTRYNRIVNMIDGAVNHVLNDDQRAVIMRKYLDRNPMTLGEISNIIHKDRTTVGRWHTEAIRRLSIALEPLTEDEKEINNVDHMFDPNWRYVEPA